MLCFYSLFISLTHWVEKDGLAVDEALPYAFSGMFFAEAYAATAGLGFLILVSRPTGFIAGALAIALITFGLLVFISSVLRFIVKRLVISEPEENVASVLANG
jgi:ABC-type nitrate/sulfonate/bicarbonate transport system permease component